MKLGRDTVQPPTIGKQLADAAASYVRDRITSGDLRPGDPVRPEAIADELGISSTPAREALQALRAEGFLELAPRRGFAVANITGDDVRDMFLVQSMVAGELAARATMAADETLDLELLEIHTELIAAVQSGDLERVEVLNHLFHRAINLAAHASRLAWIIQLSARHAPRRFYSTIPGWPETTASDHTVILDAIQRRDPDAARAAMSAHIINGGEQLATHVESRSAQED